MNKSMFKEEYAYTLDDLCEMLGVFSGTPTFSNYAICQILKFCKMLTLDGPGTSIQTNPGKLAFINASEYPASIETALSSRISSLLNKIYFRFKDNYALVSEYSSSELVSNGQFLKFFRTMFNIIDYTYDKYDRMLSIYEANRDHLLDKLQRVYSEESKRTIDIDTENSSHSKSAGSDTPQTINVSGDIEAINGYFDSFDQAADAGTSNSDSTDEYDKDTTESYDPTTLMARIKEIENDYSNIMFKWIEEFSRLFIEEGNY